LVIDITARSIKIVVDADACPVKPEIVLVGRRFVTDVWLVASYDHVMPEMEGVKVVQVDRSDQSVDLYISNCIARGDIVVTQDFGLATIGLAKGAVALSNRGQEYTDETIGFLLERRHYLAKQRRGGKHAKGPRPFTDEDRNIFLQTLTRILERLQENETN
jgi:uncharacterized protein YaiI (UPF0178 family)